MNLAQLNYIVEVEKTQSITKAAENLYMGQPNLSRSIREFENELGFQIFKRTQKGMMPTPKGEELLQRAKKILAHIEEIDQIGESDLTKKQQFSLVAPRASYISFAFAHLAAALDLELPINMNYKETNAAAAIEDVAEKNYNLGIVRYRYMHEDAFLSLFKNKKLQSEEISCFSYKILLSRRHPLARQKKITKEDLHKYIELIHGDPYIPTLNTGHGQKQENYLPDKHIYLYERGSQFDLLSEVPATYMWSSPVPEELLERHQLVLRECAGSEELYKDVLVYRQGYKMTNLDRQFINELCSARREVFK